MNPAPSQKKKIVIVILVIILAILAYIYVKGGDAAETESLLAEQAPAESTVISARVLSLLNQIQSLRIDKAFLDNQAYKSLQDYSVAIPPQNVGRPNPFAPIPGVRQSTGGAGTRSR